MATFNEPAKTPKQAVNKVRSGGMNKIKKNIAAQPSPTQSQIEQKTETDKHVTQVQNTETNLLQSHSESSESNILSQLPYFSDIFKELVSNSSFAQTLLTALQDSMERRCTHGGRLAIQISQHLNDPLPQITTSSSKRSREEHIELVSPKPAKISRIAEQPLSEAGVLRRSQSVSITTTNSSKKSVG